MKKRMAALLLAILLLSACRGQEPEAGEYKVYFAVPGEGGASASLDYEYRDLSPGEDPVEGLVKRLLAGPESSLLASPLLPGVSLRSAKLEEDGVLHLDLSEQYNGLPGIYLTVANACFVLTLTQVEGVEALSITVEGAPLPYQTIQNLRREDFLLSGGEEETVSVNTPLYFPRETVGLGAEYRTVYKTESDSLPAAVLSALLAGPQVQGLVPLPQGIVLRSIRVENQVCRVDLSQAFLDGAPADPEEGRRVVYAIVDTLCSLEGLDIDTVQLFVEGTPLEGYGGLPTEVPLEPDYSLIH